MAKVSLTKLGLKVNQDVKIVEFNGQNIEVKQYLPVNDKLELITDVINLSADNNNFANPIKVSLFATIEIIEKYTNINVTEKQKEDVAKLYDMFVSSGLARAIMSEIPEHEYDELFTGLSDSVEAVYKYRNSMMGMFDAISTDYSSLDLDATAIRDKIGDPNNLALLKDVLTKLG